MRAPAACVSFRKLRHLCGAALPKCTHVPEDGVFHIGRASLQYRLLNEEGAVVDCHHTHVPTEYRGAGIAERLCEAAFEYARASGLKVVPSCPYISDRFVPKAIDRYGDLVLATFDADTPGLEVSVTSTGVASLKLTNSRRRNPLTATILGRLREFLTATAGARAHPRWPALARS